MKNQYDLKKEWLKTKKMLIDFSKEAATLAKKGEKELVEFSKKSKVQIDATAVHLRIEKLYYQIGREYAKSKDPAKPTKKLEDLLKQLKLLEKEEKVLKSSIKKPKKKAVKKKATKKTAKKATKKS